MNVVIMSGEPTLSESEVRKLRAAIYGECTDKTWNSCKENWMTKENIQWLQLQILKRRDVP